jgi:signal transduction histidine kinase
MGDTFPVREESGMTSSIDEARVMVRSEADIVTARQHGRRLALQAGFSTTEQTPVVTAISELAHHRARAAAAAELSPLPPVVCAPGKINQVVLNLVANALGACDVGGRVTARTGAAERGVVTVHLPLRPPPRLRRTTGVYSAR